MSSAKTPTITRRRAFILVVCAIQLVCALCFVGDIAINLLGVRVTPLAWAIVELIEIGAAIGLVLGVVLGVLVLRESLRRTRQAEDALRRASSAFSDGLEERVERWALTPAERDVALLAF
jgi:hypothetical protein